MFRKGKRKTGGRKKGVPNKSTLAVKDALSEAFDGTGGIKGLIAWAKRNRGEFYRLWVRMLPTEIKADHSGGIGLTVAGVTDDELDRRIADAERKLAELVAREAQALALPATDDEMDGEPAADGDVAGPLFG